MRGRIRFLDSQHFSPSRTQPTFEDVYAAPHMRLAPFLLGIHLFLHSLTSEQDCTLAIEWPEMNRTRCRAGKTASRCFQLQLF